MYAQCKQYLLTKLKDAGLRSTPYTSMKALEKSQESHLGAVLFENEAYLRNGSKTRYSDQTGATVKRRKVFDRNLTFTVTIGEYTDDKAEEILSQFLAVIDKGLYIDGNFTPIEIDGTDWVDKDDSILKSKVAVQVKITFYGGVYKETHFAKLKELEIESVDNKKEQDDGN